jgi:hypothetical protein
MKRSSQRKKENICVDSDDTSFQGLIQTLPELSNPSVEASLSTNGDFPRCLLTAAGCLVEQEDMTEDAEAKILVSYAEGDNLLHDVYDHVIQFGGVDDFLRIVSFNFLTGISLLSLLS